MSPKLEVFIDHPSVLQSFKLINLIYFHKLIMTYYSYYLACIIYVQLYMRQLIHLAVIVLISLHILQSYSHREVTYNVTFPFTDILLRFIGIILRLLI